MHKDLKILIVEDEPLIAEDILGFLETAGFSNISIVYDYKSAAIVLEQELAEIVLLDINLEGELHLMILNLKRDEKPFDFQVCMTEYTQDNNFTGFIALKTEIDLVRLNIEGMRIIDLLSTTGIKFELIPIIFAESKVLESDFEKLFVYLLDQDKLFLAPPDKSREPEENKKIVSTFKDFKTEWI